MPCHRWWQAAIAASGSWLLLLPLPSQFLWSHCNRTFASRACWHPLRATAALLLRFHHPHMRARPLVPRSACAPCRRPACWGTARLTPAIPLPDLFKAKYSSRPLTLYPLWFPRICRMLCGAGPPAALRCGAPTLTHCPEHSTRLSPTHCSVAPHAEGELSRAVKPSTQTRKKGLSGAGETVGWPRTHLTGGGCRGRRHAARARSARLLINR